jgi:HAD superfamily hydrolase (TIGR01490 family)
MTPVAIIDVDGTLLTHDSLPVLLALGLRRRPARVANVALRAPSIAAHSVRDTSASKERLLGAVLGGLRASEVSDLGSAVASRVRLSAQLQEQIASHRQHGDDVWLASASIEPVVAALADRVGAKGYVATRLHFDQDRFTGRFLGANCKGHEKVRRLDEVLGEHWRSYATAYSDSRSDRPLMEAAASCRWVRRGVLL